MGRLFTFIYAVWAGAAISIGGTAYLSLDNKIAGALFFSVGLFTIVTMGLNLFTGKVCYVFQRDKTYGVNLPLIWLGNLAGAVFEIFDPFTYAVLATIETDAYGVAASPGLPIGRYIIREKTAAPYFGLSGKETEVYIKINNDVVRVEYQAAPLDLKITHTVTGNANAAAGSFSKYLFTAVNNDSSSRLGDPPLG